MAVASLFGVSLMVELQTLNLPVGVRVPDPDPKNNLTLRLNKIQYVIFPCNSVGRVGDC